MKLSQEEAMEAMEQALGHQFANRDLLLEALTHRSAVSGRDPRRGKRAQGPKGTGSNERLEFIG
ncbi:ribonuclease, partial [Gluconobacter japonicus]